MTDTAIRHAGLKHMLTTRRDAFHAGLQSRIRDGRAQSPADVGDDLDESDAGVQRELAFALLEMRAETLAGIDAALARLDAGQYEFCLECGGEIAARRLHALPFAVRCQACEERCEQEQGHARRFTRRSADVPIVPDVLGC